MKTQLSSDKKIVYILLCLGCVTISFNVAAITAAIPTISTDFNQPDFLVAQIIPYYLIPYGVGALIYAPLTRFLSYRIVLALSLLLYASANFMCGIAQSLDQLLIARIVMGIAGASAIPLGLMVIGDFYNKEIRGRLVGVFFSMSFFSSLVGIVLSGIADWRWLFFVPAALGCGLSLMIILSRQEILGNSHDGHINYVRVLSQRQIQHVFLFIFFISMLYHGVHKWYGVYLSRDYSLDQMTISIFFVITLIGGLIGQLVGGVLSDRRGRLFTCALGIFGLGVGIILLYGQHTLYILGVILGFISFSWTVGHNGISTVLTDFEKESRPAMASLNSSVRFISGGLGFWVSSFFVVKSFSLTFLGIGILILLILLILRCMTPINQTSDI